MRVCLGGTFHPFHVGHEALLRVASRGAASLWVGITTEELAQRPDRQVPPWEERADVVRSYLAGLGFAGEVTVGPLRDAMGPAADGDFDAIAASAETRRGADAINRSRQEAGLAPLQVRHVPHVLAQDLLPVSGTRIEAGQIDRDGRRLQPVRIAVGSQNPVKVAAVRQEMSELLDDVEVVVHGVQVASGVPEQPKDAQTLAGAQQRARNALEAVPDADYAVGIEAGLCLDPAGYQWYDVQACVVLDRLGRMTDGWGPAFQYPAWVTERAQKGEMISEILGPVAQDERIGGTTGAIGFLTDGRYDRTALTRTALLMAFVPRLRRDLYDLPASPVTPAS